MLTDDEDQLCLCCRAEADLVSIHAPMMPAYETHGAMAEPLPRYGRPPGQRKAIFRGRAVSLITPIERVEIRGGRASILAKEAGISYYPKKPLTFK